MNKQRMLTCCCFALWALTSCADSSDDTGMVQLAITDAPADDIDRFEVDVLSVDLVMADGTNVSALPLTTRIDFSELVGLAEIINVASIPAGTYVQARVTLDLMNADVHLVGESTDATVLDGTGNPFVDPATVDVRLPPFGPLVVAPGITRIFTLDFDLNASTIVDLAANTVHVSPVLVADVDQTRPRPHRVRGPLESVDPDDGSVVLSVHPFNVVLADFGKVRITTDAETFFEINGESFQGSAGVDAMAGLPQLTAVVAVGEYDGEGTFVANDVLAGSSVVGGTLDAAVGIVVARSGDTLTLRGARLDRAGGTLTFNEEVTVVMDPATTHVARHLSLDACTTDDVSVGQRIVVLGTLDTEAASPTFAESEWIRMVRTGVTGTVNSVAAGTMVVHVKRLGLRDVADFDFTGTGSSADADPLAYEVDTGTLDLDGLGAGDPVRVLGYVAPFGSDGADFEALSVSNLSKSSLLGVIWSPESTTQFSSLSGSGIELDLTESPLVHHVDRGGDRIDLTGLPNPSVIPAGVFGLHAISDHGTVTLFANFTNFVLELENHLVGGRTVQRLAALGSFDDTTGALSGSVVVVVLKP